MISCDHDDHIVPKNITSLMWPIKQNTIESGQIKSAPGYANSLVNSPQTLAVDGQGQCCEIAKRNNFTKPGIRHP